MRQNPVKKMPGDTVDRHGQTKTGGPTHAASASAHLRLRLIPLTGTHDTDAINGLALRRQFSHCSRRLRRALAGLETEAAAEIEDRLARRAFSQSILSLAFARGGEPGC